MAGRTIAGAFAGVATFAVRRTYLRARAIRALTASDLFFELANVAVFTEDAARFALAVAILFAGVVTQLEYTNQRRSAVGGAGARLR